MIGQIRIRGHLGDRWTDWFEGSTIMLEGDGETLLTGPVVDQATLHGVPKVVRDPGTPLLSVNRLDLTDLMKQVRNEANADGGAR